MSLASCHVQKHSTTEGVTEYFINVVFIGKQWGIRKRYRDFLKFDEFLRKDGIIINSELPPKKWWNRLDPTLIAIRMKALQGYLDELLKYVSLSENSLVREFLEVDVINLEVAKVKSIKGIDYNDRMKIIINDASKNMISISGYQRPTINKINSSDKKDKKSNKSATIPIPKMTNYDNNGTPIPSPSSSSAKGSPIVSSPVVSSSYTSSSFTRKIFKRTESNASMTDYERPLYERRFTFDRINSLGHGSSSSTSANTAFGSALYEAASDGLKKDIFTQHVLKIWPSYQSQTDDIMIDIEYKSLPAPLANNENEILKFMKEPLTIVADLDHLLDTCADILLESAPKHSVAFSLSDDFVVEKFKTPPPPKNDNKSNTDSNNNNIEQDDQQNAVDIITSAQPSPRNLNEIDTTSAQPSPSPRKLSKACRI